MYAIDTIHFNYKAIRLIKPELFIGENLARHPNGGCLSPFLYDDIPSESNLLLNRNKSSIPYDMSLSKVSEACSSDITYFLIFHFIIEMLFKFKESCRSISK